MKNIIKLGMLAALANVSVHAVTVNFGGTQSTTPYPSTIVSAPTGVTASGYYWDQGSLVWRDAKVTQTTEGVGVAGIADVSLYQGSPFTVDGFWQEYIMLDFGSATNVVTALELNYPTYNGTTVTPQSPYFKYAWVSGAPTGTTPNVSTGFTNFTGTVSPVNPTNVGADYTFSNIPGTGRYLLLGAVNSTLSTSNYFKVASVTYTSVPDGASTLALMGAALATLGFAGRRRKA